MISQKSLVVPIKHLNKVDVKTIEETAGFISIFHGNYVACNGVWFTKYFLDFYFGDDSATEFFRSQFRTTADFNSTKNFLISISGKDVSDDDVYLYLNVIRGLRDIDRQPIFYIDEDTNIKRTSDGRILIH